MSGKQSIGKQVLLAIMAVMFIINILSLIAFYVVYGAVEKLAPQIVKVSDFPNGLDFAILSGCFLIGFFLASALAIRLAGRIIAPLESVAASARRIATGDLTARADTGDKPFGETAVLVEDFNTMSEALEKTSNEISTWNALIAHELRTPVTILIGRLQGLEDGVFSPDASLFAALRKQAEGLGRLVEDLRTVSLSSSGHLHLVKEPTDLAKDLGELALVLRADIREAGFHLEPELSPCVVPVDAARIRQCVVALIDNALKYANPCTLQLRVAPTETGVEISLMDQGPGLDTQFEAVAFEPFRRGRIDALGNRAGTGLGLAVVRAIVDAHGGAIRYERGQGSFAFVITMPTPATASQYT